MNPMPLNRFHGGLRLAGHKQASAGSPIVRLPCPARLVVSMQQQSGAAAEVIVAEGDQLRLGQRIGQAAGEFSACVHAPTAGRVESIDWQVIPHPSGLTTPCVTILCDEADVAEPAAEFLPPLEDWQTRSPDELRQRILDCGVVGLGGAAFPTAEKLSVGRDVLILNGAECEPWIACDDRLLRERAGEVINGGRLLRHITGAARLIVALEDRMQDALAAVRAALDERDEIEIVAVPTRYPQGGERQLIKVLLGREVPSGGLPRDVGALVQNVATAAACWRAVTSGEPLIRRVVSVTGPGVVRPGNFDVAIGTPIGALIAAAGGYTEGASRLIQGGPLMGYALPSDDLPIVKSSNCILVLTDEEIRETAPELPCIRCGACADVCPAKLLPQQLLAFTLASQWSRVQEHHLFDCIECGCCDLVCPSHIPLVEHYRHAKTELRAAARETVVAQAARDRYEARARRMQSEIERRAARQAARSDPTSASAVEAAIARAKAKQLAEQSADGGVDSNGSDPSDGRSEKSQR